MAAALILLGVLGWSGVASAHAVLISSNPLDDEVVATAPLTVDLTFSEPVDVDLGGVTILDPDGHEIEPGRILEEDGGKKLIVPMVSRKIGTHTVVWRVTSADGHTIEGSLVFHVGERRGGASRDLGSDTPVTILLWTGRFVSLLGLVAAIGALGWDLTTRGRDGRARDLILGGIPLVLGSTVVLLAKTAEATGDSIGSAITQLPDAVTTTRFGGLLMMQMLAGVAMTIGWFVRRHRLSWLSVGWVASLVAILAVSMGGHAWTADHRGTAVLADSLHMLAAGLWLGGLGALLRESTTDASDANPSDAEIRRFSTVALGTMLVLGASGVVGALEHLGAFDELWTTDYGRLLLAKTVIFAIVLLFGLLNRQILLPRFTGLAARLRPIVRVEIVIGLLAIGLAAALVDVPPPGTTTNEPYAETQTYVKNVLGSYNSYRTQP